MKVLVKWKKSILVLLLLFMVLVVYITIGSKTDEKSKYGYTLFRREGAITHIKDPDVNICTPKNFIRFFRDSINTGIVWEMKKRNMDFLAVSSDYETCREFYFLPEQGSVTGERAEELIRGNQGNYSITGELSHEDLKLGDIDFHRVCYSRKDNVYLDYGVVAEYFTEHKGKWLEIRCYTEYDKEPDFDMAISDVCDEAEQQLENYSFGAVDFQPESETGLWDAVRGITFAPWVLLLPFIYAFFCGMTYMGHADKIYDTDMKRYIFVGDEGSGWNEDFLSLSVSKMLLGIFSILIVLHHLVQQAGEVNSGLLVVLEDFGVGLVGTFFFFSGFGLYESYKSKSDYLQGFLKKRLSSVLIPFYTTNLIYFLYEILHNNRADAGEIIAWLTGWTLLNTHTWYIVEIVMLYLIFYGIFRTISNKKLGILLLFISVLVLMTVSLLLGHGSGWLQGEWWYNTTLLFPIGVLFAEYRKDITYYMKRLYYLLLPVAFVLFTVFYRATEHMLKVRGYWTDTGLDKGYDDKLCTLAVQLPMVIFFVMFILLLGLKLRIGNRFLAFLGGISLELYLIHALFFQIFSDVTGTGMFFLCVLAAAIPAAAMLSYVHKALLCLIAKKPIPAIHWRWGVVAEAVSLNISQAKEFFSNAGRAVVYAFDNKGKTGKMIFRYAFCIFLCVLSIVPIFMLLINATRSSHDIVHGFSFLPGGKFAENFLAVKGYMEDMGLNLFEVVGSSCLIAITCTVLGTYIGALCAYGFEYYSFKRKKVLWWVVMAALMMPAAAGSVGFMKLVVALHLYNNLLPIIVTGITIPSCVFFMRMYMHTLRLHEIIEAARIDGSNELLTFNRIILPVIRPAIFLQLIINFANSWNNTLYQNYIMIDVHKKTLAVFLNTMTGVRGSGSDPEVYGLLLVSTIPSLFMFIIFSRGITANINLGGVKE